MTKRILSMALIAVLMAVMFPVVNEAKADWTMYVYTDNGKTLNVRSAPVVADNIVAQAKYGEPVTVVATSSNGWSTLWWQDNNGEFHYYYVQSRFLVNYKPGAKPTSQPAPTSASQTTAEFDAMNAEFRSARKVYPYTVVARPTRASGWVNLRWAPSTDAEVITTCSQGKELTVLAELKTWYQVEDPATGMIGFIMSKYVSRK